MMISQTYDGLKLSKDRDVRVSLHVIDPLRAHFKFLQNLKKDLKKPATNLRKKDKRHKKRK